MDYFEKCAKEAFTKLIDNITKKENVKKNYQTQGNLYNIVTDNGKKLTALGLLWMADGYVFRDAPNDWGITPDEADIIRGFFKDHLFKDSLIFLYKYFSKSLQGEPRERLLIQLQEKEIPKSLSEIPVF
ncbi:MAG: hypothetical protein ACOYT4_02160 [Nanoarchaeota archaeon]